LMPVLFISYILAYIDRINIGFAALTMNADLGLSPYIYGLGAGVFFLGYFIFEIPSNLMLEKTGARRWIARIMISWGLLSAAMGSPFCRDGSRTRPHKLFDCSLFAGCR
jgi:ACS family tartrate transporter-like MFS transporter